MARAEARLRRKGGLPRSLIERASDETRHGHAHDCPAAPAGARGDSTVGTIETAFSALMRLSLRLMVERGGSDDRLGFYLDDPIQLFMPARLMLGLIFSLAKVVLAVLTGSGILVHRDAAALRGGLHPAVRARAAAAHRAAIPKRRSRFSSRRSILPLASCTR